MGVGGGRYDEPIDVKVWNFVHRHHATTELSREGVGLCGRPVTDDQVTHKGSKILCSDGTHSAGSDNGNSHANSNPNVEQSGITQSFLWAIAQYDTLMWTVPIGSGNFHSPPVAGASLVCGSVVDVGALGPASLGVWRHPDRRLPHERIQG